MKKGLSITRLAEESGVGYATIANVESGRTQNPRAEARDRLATALGVTEPAAVTAATEEAAEVEGVGQFVDFDPHEVASRPKDPGIYVFYDVSDRPIYVGESDAISRRIRSHEEKFWFKRPIVERASYIKIADPELRRQIERILIRFLKSNAVLIANTSTGRAAGRQPQPSGAWIVGITAAISTISEAVCSNASTTSANRTSGPSWKRAPNMHSCDLLICPSPKPMPR